MSPARRRGSSAPGSGRGSARSPAAADPCSGCCPQCPTFRHDPAVCQLCVSFVAGTSLLVLTPAQRERPRIPRRDAESGASPAVT
ncbi:hypothetical protein [Ornithinimicrobium kibberense]|uniref:hypothetical protein n=1 Tax=Ornithinimicrobium kibberense TaxID=282060 RepID=UPI00361BFABC